MFGVIYRKLKIIQLEDLTSDFLNTFYKEEANRQIVLGVYRGQVYLTNVAFEELPRTPLNSWEVYYHVVYRCKNKTVNVGKDSERHAKKLLGMYPHIRYVMVKDSAIHDMQECAFYCSILFDREGYLAEVREVREKLKQKGILSCIARIPQLEEIAEEFRHQEWMYGGLDSWPIWGEVNKKEVGLHLNKITDLRYEEFRKKMLEQRTPSAQNAECSIYRREEFPPLFLIGPCIVGGWQELPGETLADGIASELTKSRLNYSVVKIVTPRGTENRISLLLECDIHKNDIVIFIDDVFSREETDFDMTDLYQCCQREKWLYTNTPIHTTFVGNQLIAEKLVRKWIAPLARNTVSKDDCEILHKGQPQLTKKEKEQIQEYLDSVRKYNQKGHVIGSCVMNCNPFTLGHRYLIEYASRQVDILYLFVLEEDASLFTFEERMEMVLKGVEDLDNVKVYPSGRFIISRDTFKNYFEKEVCLDTVIDAAKDTMIFREYIAPALGITRRFVGEEPKDPVTRQYNQLLKRDLSESIDVVEVPRKDIKGEVISASRVREYLGEENWDEIKKMVPPSTLSCLQDNFPSLRERMCQKKNGSRKLEAGCLEGIRFIEAHENVVICGLGQDGKALIEQLDEYQLKKVEFYDVRADEVSFFYKGKRVIGSERLLIDYKDFYMLVATRAYGMDIFCLLAENNIPLDHIMVL